VTYDEAVDAYAEKVARLRDAHRWVRDRMIKLEQADADFCIAVDEQLVAIGECKDALAVLNEFKPAGQAAQ
jgi:Mg2+ and Co2+ transporter CorA